MSTEFILIIVSVQAVDKATKTDDRKIKETSTWSCCSFEKGPFVIISIKFSMILTILTHPLNILMEQINLQTFKPYHPTSEEEM